MVDRLPPHNIDSEEALLGALMIGAELESASICPEDFYSERNRWIFEACQSLRDRKVSLNEVTISQELAGKEKLDNCGGAAYLSHLISVCPTHLDYKYYAEIVHRLAWYRKLIAASDQIASIAYQANADITGSINKADDILLQLRKGYSTNSIISPEKRVELLNERYCKLYESEGVVAISTGLKDLDHFLGGGLFEGDLNIIGARPSMGKTTLIQGIGNYIAKTVGNVLMFSCEMDNNALSDRDIAGIVGVPINTVRLGKYDEILFSKIIQSLDEIRETKLYIYDETPITTAKIMQASMNMKLRIGLSAIVVDYLGLLDDEVGENRNITLGYMTKKLKQVARELNIPVIVAHQLSRELERRDDKRPMLSDLRESGHIEEDADNVIFLYRDSYYYDEEAWNSKNAGEPYPANVTELIIAKQRQGESNRAVRVYFDKAHQKFRDLREGY